MSVNDLADREERPAYVRFEKRPIEDKLASKEAGCVQYKDVDYVLVTPPYSKDCFESKAERWFAQTKQNVASGRTPQKWLDHWIQSYESWKAGEDAPINGTSIKNWSAVTPAQVKSIISSGVLTIEDLANANDQGIRRLGMGGQDLKNKAMAYVKAAKDTGPLVMENAALKNQVVQLEGSLASMQTQMEAMSHRLESMQSQPLMEVSNEISVSDIIDPAVEAPKKFGSKAEQDHELVAAYIEKFGKKPHHMSKDASIRQKLEE